MSYPPHVVEWSARTPIERSLQSVPPAKVGVWATMPSGPGTKEFPLKVKLAYLIVSGSAGNVLQEYSGTLQTRMISPFDVVVIS